jgi:hypothetical protein
MKTKRTIIAASTVLAVLLGSLWVGSGVASAAVGRSLAVPFANEYSYLPRTLVAGDCRQIGLNQDPPFHSSYVRLEPPGAGLYARFTWNFSIYTVDTFWGDVWHATFLFKNASGGTLSIVKYDGPKMGDEGTIEQRMARGWRSFPIRMDQSTYETVAQVDWIGDC